MRQAIEQRRQESGGTIRYLVCGHQQKEPKGGKAKDAKFALCFVCRPKVQKVEEISGPDSPQVVI